MSKYILSMALLAAAFIPTTLAAETLEYTTADRTITITHPDVLNAAGAVPIGFALTDYAGDKVPFKTIWIRLTKGGGTVFSGELSGESLNYQFPEVGEYELYTRFTHEGGTAAEHTFPISVGEDGSSGVVSFINYTVALLVGVGGGLVVRTIRKRGSVAK